jgi:hypothetical protein
MDASEIDPRGDRGLARWLATLPGSARVVDLRDCPTPVDVPMLWLPTSDEAEPFRICRCGEVVVEEAPFPDAP